MGAGLLTTGRGGQITKVYLAKDVVTKVYFCKSPRPVLQPQGGAIA